MNIWYRGGKGVGNILFDSSIYLPTYFLNLISPSLLWLLCVGFPFYVDRTPHSRLRLPKVPRDE